MARGSRIIHATGRLLFLSRHATTASRDTSWGNIRWWIDDSGLIYSNSITIERWDGIRSRTERLANAESILWDPAPGTWSKLADTTGSEPKKTLDYVSPDGRMIFGRSNYPSAGHTEYTVEGRTFDTEYSPQDRGFRPLIVNSSGRVVGYDYTQKKIAWGSATEGPHYLDGASWPSGLSSQNDVVGHGQTGAPKIWRWEDDGAGNWSYRDYLVDAAPPPTDDLTMAKINASGLIAAYRNKRRDAQGDPLPAGQLTTTPVLLVPAELAVDANRDGTITLAHANTDPALADSTSADQPFRFWANDDNDGTFVSSQETEQDDLEVYNDNYEDWRNDYIFVARDLEDYARLRIYIGGLSDAIRSGTLHIGLKWSDTGQTAPSIKLFKQQEPGGTGYLNDPVVAGEQVTDLGSSSSALNSSYSWAIPNMRNLTTPLHSEQRSLVVPGETFVIPPAFFESLTESNPHVHLLFEGCRVGSGQLKLVILKQENGTFTEIGEGPGVWLDIKKPHEFIQRWTCGNGSLAAVQPVQFEASKSGSFAAPVREEEKDLILYVHGYNMLADWEKQRWIEATYKRLYWLGYKGRVGGFSWPCVLDDGSKFDASEELAWQAGAQLHSLLVTLKQQGYRVHLLGHSMGNIVIGEALRLAGPNSELVTTYIASQAAIAAHCYDASLPDRTDFTPSTPNVYGRYWTAGQSQSLPETWGSLSPSYLAPTYVQGAARKFVNFYNPQDWALTGNGLNLSASADDGSQIGWMTDQRLKPNNGYDYVAYGGFRENPMFHISPRWFEFPDDRFTIFPYCAEARSIALGAGSAGGVFVGSDVNLFDAPINYRNQHIYHSAQFRSFYAQRWQYWHKILDACLLLPRAQP